MRLLAVPALSRLLPRGSRVLAAVSGGPDSVAMAHLLHGLQRQAGFTLAAIAHFNHQLRGEEANADAAFCRDLATALGVPFVTDSADVAGRAREWKTSLEDAARRLRYEFLERARRQVGADLVAVGHTRDDQAETLLLRLLRGAGPRGLAGIRRKRGPIVRPLLDVGRAELHAWLASEGIAFRTDATNADLSIPRNRVRHELLPLLERIAPGAAATIARTAEIAGADEDFLETRAIEVAASVVLHNEGELVRLDAVRLRELHPAIARRVARRFMEQVARERFIGLNHVDALLALDEGGLDLPGLTARLKGGVLTLSAGSPAKTPESNVFRYPLSIPGEARIQESGVAISAEFVIGRGAAAEKTSKPDRRAARPAGNATGVTVSGHGLTGGLAVRNRRPGDRFRPLGLRGTKKLQDYFVDRKVPRAERDRVPLVVDAADRIVWVVGHAIAEDFRVTEPEGAVLLLKVRHLGDQF